MGQIILIRKEELYSLVWSDPLFSFFKKNSISNPGVHKLCKEINMPKPQIGRLQKKSV
jgi:hypothetical protein